MAGYVASEIARRGALEWSSRYFFFRGPPGEAWPAIFSRTSGGGGVVICVDFHTKSVIFLMDLQGKRSQLFSSWLPQDRRRWAAHHPRTPLTPPMITAHAPHRAAGYTEASLIVRRP